MPCAPLRILCNEQNLIRTAGLTPSSVKPADNTVLVVPAARSGTGSVTLTGSYTGSEDATLDIQILDDTPETRLGSTPVLAGAGTGTLTDVTATGGFTPQALTVELKDAGVPLGYAAVNFEGVKLVAAAGGVLGNDIHIHVDAGIESSPPGLVFTATAYSLLVDIQTGQGGPTTGFVGSGFDWGQPALGDDGVIPASAPRVAFGDDTSVVYTAYKQWAAGAWSYYLVPALVRPVPKGTAVMFVTGGRTVTITDSPDSPPTVETYTGIETVYDLLSKIREGSALVTVEGIVANDRTPSGQAARELLTRTDAHVEPSTGTGSRYATGFSSAYSEPGASTELVTVRCYAVTGRDHPLAHLGAERWTVSGSLAGALADAVSGVPYVTNKWGFVIPQRLPPGVDTPRGGISAAVGYAPRSGIEVEPPICVVGMLLGPAASDQTVTFTYRTRRTDLCACDGMDVPNLSGECLGTFGSGGDVSMSYSADARSRLEDLYDWAGDLAANVTQYLQGYMANGVPDDLAPAGTSTYSESRNSATSVPGVASIANSGAAVGYVNTALDGGLVYAQFSSFGLPADFQDLVDAFEKGIQAIDELDSGALKNAGWTKWDLALAAASADLSSTSPGDRYATVATDKYKIMIRKALAYAGISPMGKSDANTLKSGDGCWRDTGAAAWWVAETGGYAPVFSNEPYWSSRQSGNEGKFYSTKEFAFQINVACTQRLEDGDQVTISINDSAWPSTYQVGDEITLPVVAAGDLYLAGGQNANTVQIWNVRGSVSGPLANYTLDTAAPSAYSASGLGFQINKGGIGFVIGDKFIFAIEGGHFVWRVNAGAWNVDSPPLDITGSQTPLYTGLSVTFTAGEAPSFAAGDTYSFRILQPRAASNLQAPGPESWQWVADDQAIDVDLGSSQSIANLAIALHTLPAGCTITVEGSISGGSPFADWTETLTRVEGPIYKELAAVRTARYLRVTLNDAPNATIGWLFAGAPITTTLSADLSLSRAWKIDRGAGGLYQGGRYLGKAVAGEIEWTEGSLPESDVTALQAMLDWVKSHDDEPIIIVPNVTRPAEAFLGRVAVDEVEFPDVFMYGPNSGKARRHETRFPVAGAWS